jgi:hypothetical protein
MGLCLDLVYISLINEYTRQLQTILPQECLHFYFKNTYNYALGALIGIIVGIVGGLIVLAIIIMVLVRKSRNSKNDPADRPITKCVKF